MSVKIVELEYVDGENGQFFEFTVKFKIQKEDESYFCRLQEWMPITYVNDPKLHNEQVSKLKIVSHPIPGSDHFSLEFEGPPVTEDWKHGFMRGLDCLSVENDVFTFHEFFTKTPVTLALVEEIKKFQTNSGHTADSDFATISPHYFSTLLECLFYHWD